ncbi:hypothetical protein SHIRM173S_00948 [Streptomyces hirsutus]
MTLAEVSESTISRSGLYQEIVYRYSLAEH